MATGRLIVWAAIGAAMWVEVATGAWPTSTGAWPTTAGAVRMGAGRAGACRRGACRRGACRAGAARGRGAARGAAGASRPALAEATAAKIVRAIKYDCERSDLWFQRRRE